MIDYSRLHVQQPCLALGVPSWWWWLLCLPVPPPPMLLREDETGSVRSVSLAVFMAAEQSLSSSAIVLGPFSGPPEAMCC